MTFTEVPSEVIHQLKFDHPQTTLGNHNAESQPFKITNITKMNTNTSLKESPAEQKLQKRIPSQPMDTNLNEYNKNQFYFLHY